jgi:hypothetical protein
MQSFCSMVSGFWDSAKIVAQSIYKDGANIENCKTRGLVHAYAYELSKSVGGFAR